MSKKVNTVLITGASSGIGAATAKLFAQNGWQVAATMRHPEQANTTPQRENVIRLRLDVTDESTIASAVAAANAQFGSIDVLVNNAGYALNGPLEALTSDQVAKQLTTNIAGVMAVTRHVLPTMRQQRSGTIVNISSIGGRIAFPFAATYHATKFAVEGLSESIRYELKPHGIAVKIVEPGGIKTGFIDAIEWGRHAAYEPQLTSMIEIAKRLNDRLPGPEAVANVIYKAATDQSGRLRYTAKTGPYLMMNAILPDRLWRGMVGSMLRSQAGGKP
jgi:NADP-dependent 3-hydroxy acid dehydrogenase YdfG